jgi:serine/threonine protein kinase/Tfp pilus assembly protein PilF
MDAQRWATIESVYHAVLARDPGERSSYLDVACAEDPALRHEVESLLAYAGAQLGNPLEAAELEKIRDRIAGEHLRLENTASTEIDSAESEACKIGPYHLLQLIGQGGMGEVWLAEQKAPVRRRVALKLIKAGMDTREVVTRFESERQALALMDHPAIAKVFDAGSTPQGRPYFVMEYVTGMPITAYCDKHRLTTQERLELFVHVCEGVQHAHQKAIIHRDLKPSNILVTEVDGKPAPKIIDFGVAKAMSQRLTTETLFTRVGMMLGTPEYMSPEQADSAGQDVDTRTDVYSLGAVLYELLVGALPLDLRKLSFEDMLRRLREDDAPRPSTKLRTLGEQSTATAQNRRTEPKTLAKQLRGDLDAITLKALEKNRSRRYGTPSDLAADIGRYLRHEPVTVRAASLAYRARKYVRRHRVGVAVAAGLILLLASFAIVQAVALRRITRERDRADRVTTFMTSMFKVSDPSEARGNKVTAREILDKASKDINTGLANDPELQAQMMHVMGTVYFNLGSYSRAESLLRRAVEIRQRLLGPEHLDTLKSKRVLASTLVGEARYPEAEKLYRETLAIQRRILGPEHPDNLSLTNNLAGVVADEGRLGEAEKLFRANFNVESRVLGSENPETLRSADNLVFTMDQDGRYAEAEKLERHTLEVKRRVLGPDHPQTLHSIENLADTLDSEGRYAEAENLERELIAIRLRILGPEHEDTLVSMMNDGLMLAHLGRYPEAEQALRKVLDAQRRVLGPEHRETLASMSMLSSTFMHLGRYAEAETLQRETFDLRRRLYGPDHPDTAVSAYDLACIEAHMGQSERALALLRQAVDHGLDRPTSLGLETDDDLKSLQGNPGFKALIAHVHERFKSPTTTQ